MSANRSNDERPMKALRKNSAPYGRQLVVSKKKENEEARKAGRQENGVLAFSCLPAFLILFWE
jgi:hypothetical protein